MSRQALSQQSISRAWLVLIALLVVLVAATMVGTARPLSAQQTPTVTNGAVGINFPTQLLFSGIVDSAQEVTDVSLLYQVPPEGALTRIPAVVTTGEIVRLEAAIGTNAGDQYVPPGADINYRWQITFADGSTFESEEELYRYEDPRYDWQVIESGGLSVYYYGSSSVAQQILDAGAAGIAEMSRVLNVNVPFPIKLYLWNNLDDANGVELVRSAQFDSVVDTLGTRVLADLVHVFAPTVWITVHELTHVLTHFAGEGGIGELPAWLDEGTATYSEGDWESRRGFVVNTAIGNDDLLSVRSITSSPGDPSRVELFYGQSADIVDFLINEFGEEKFAQLYAVFKAGSTADNALMEVYGVDRDGLEDRYRQSVGLDPRVRGEDQSTVIEDAPADAAPAESALPDAPVDAAPAADEPAPIQRTQAEIDARVSEIEERQSIRRLTPRFSSGGGFPTYEVVTGIAVGALLLAIVLLVQLTSRSGPAPAADTVLEAPAFPPPPVAPVADPNAEPDDDGVETLTFPAPNKDPD